MRLFVAIVPPADVIQDAVGRVARLPSAVRAELRRTAPERFHLTLAFLGDVDEHLVGPLAECLAGVAAAAGPMALRLAGAGHFDGRVLWLGLTGEVPPLQTLAGDVADAVTQQGLLLDQKPFRPHVTVARPRGALDVLGAVAALSSYEGPPWNASELVLMRSRLGPVPAYERQADWLLRRAAATGRTRRA